MLLTGRLAEFAASLKYEDIPAAIIGKAKDIILDTIGVGLGGAEAPSSRIVHDVMRHQGGITGKHCLWQGW